MGTASTAPATASAPVYDISTTAGQLAIIRAARKDARFMLWLAWQKNRVPRDLGAVAWAMIATDFADGAHTQMRILAGEQIRAATPRELVAIRRLMLQGYLNGLTEAFAQFLAQSDYQVPRIVSNRAAGWR